MSRRPPDSFVYCFWLRGRPWGELPIYAFDGASADLVAQRIRERLEAMGYANISVTPGSCPPKDDGVPSCRARIAGPGPGPR
jgi:hypothetical protein